MTIRTAAIALIFLVAASVPAQSRPDTRNYTCGGLLDYLHQVGAAVMSTGPHTFDRFAVSRRFCARTEYLQNTWVPTRDTRRCVVKRCRDIELRRFRD